MESITAHSCVQILVHHCPVTAARKTGLSAEVSLKAMAGLPKGRERFQNWPTLLPGGRPRLFGGSTRTQGNPLLLSGLGSCTLTPARLGSHCQQALHYTYTRDPHDSTPPIYPLARAPHLRDPLHRGTPDSLSPLFFFFFLPMSPPFGRLMAGFSLILKNAPLSCPLCGYVLHLFSLLESACSDNNNHHLGNPG